MDNRMMMVVMWFVVGIVVGRMLGFTLTDAIYRFMNTIQAYIDKKFHHKK